MLPWILLPTVGALIGFATNWLAIRMLFHPREKRFGVQGLLPRRQADLAQSVGQVVGEDLVQIDAVLAPLAEMDLKPHFTALVDGVIEKKVADFQSIPLIGAMITPERMSGLRDLVVDELVANQPVILAKVKEVASEHVDIAKIAEEKIAAFDMDTLEGVVRRVAKTEFRAIEWWGALLGAVIGLAQAGLLALVG